MLCHNVNRKRYSGYECGLCTCPQGIDWLPMFSSGRSCYPPCQVAPQIYAQMTLGKQADQHSMLVYTTEKSTVQWKWTYLTLTLHHHIWILFSETCRGCDTELNKYVFSNWQDCRGLKIKVGEQWALKLTAKRQYSSTYFIILGGLLEDPSQTQKEAPGARIQVQATAAGRKEDKSKANTRATPGKPVKYAMSIHQGAASRYQLPTRSPPKGRQQH